MESGKDHGDLHEKQVDQISTELADDRATILNERNNVDVIDITAQTFTEEEKKDEKKAKTGLGAYLRLFKFSSPLDICLRICGFLAAVSAGAALPLMTIFFGRLVNNFNNYGAGDAAAAQLLGAVSDNTLILVYLFVGKFAMVYIHTSCFTITANRAASAMRQAYIQALLRQDISYFDDATPGSVATSISTNADLVQNGLGEKLGIAFQGVAMLFAAYIVAFTQQWRLTLVTMTTMPAAVTAVGITVFLDSKMEAKILKIYAKAGGLVEEALSSIRLVTAFGATGKLRKRYDIYLDAATVYGKKKGPILGVQYSAEFFIMYCAYALSFWYGIRLLLAGEIGSPGKIMTVLFAVLIGTSSITMIAPSIGEFAKATAAASEIFAVLDRKLNIDPLSSDGETPEPGTGSFSMKNVSFSYPARPTIKVLDDVCLEFEAGRTTAIVGASGSGKSTIVALLERWYDPLEGQIFLDGHEIKRLNVRWLRGQVGYVQQEPVLFNNTVYENVAYGLFSTPSDSLPESEKRKLVQAACIEANADSFIQELPQGYDTNVGERGGLVSGGQKQRIAIARSIVSNPRILLLDEATSALDPKAEEIVQAALDRVSKSRTTVMIAHKLSTVQKADKIVVMTQGKVIEEGSPASLLAKNGAYASLVNAQNLNVLGEEPSREYEKHEGKHEEMTLQRSTTPIMKSYESIEEPEDASRNLSLFRCVYTILYEHRRLWPYMLCGTIATLVGGGVFPLQAYLFSKIITVFQLPRDRLESRGNFWALMFFIMALGVLFAYASIGFFFTILAYKASRVYRSEYFEAMLRQDATFFDQDDHSAGAMTSKLSTDSTNLQQLLSSNIGLILIVIVNLVGSCTLALAVGWKLAVVAIFGCIPPLFFAGFWRMRLEMSAQDRSAKPYRESARFVTEAVSAIRTVSSLTLESKILAHYGDRLDSTVRSSYKHTLLTMILFGLSESLDLAATALAFWWGAKLLSQGEYSTQAFFIVFTAVIFGGQAAGFLFGYTLNTTKAHSAANQIIHLRKSKCPINSSTGVEPDLNSVGSTEHIIAFKDVRFAYPTRLSVPVLRSLSLSIRKGQSVGVVGASGCGKTTLIALLERFYDIESGSLQIGGTELRDLDVHAYRAKIGLVSQETTIYQGSVRENILLGLKDEEEEEKDQERVEEACKAANIHDFILSLPAGYDTDCGSHGLALSGGQRQRLAIARALIRNPDILLFDEATSALDTQSERVVQEALIRAGVGRTVVSVAHRLSTVRGCDVIFVLERGRVVEEGTHGELVRRGGVYKKMVDGQMLEREVG